VIYHTNSLAFKEFYEMQFRMRGLSNIKFIHTP